jgi:hypothetical protein
MKEDMEIALQQKAKISGELDAATEYIITMEEKVYKSNKISLELLEQLKECELELGQLPYGHYGGYAAPLYNDYNRRIANYAPIQTDIVDSKMSEFINLHPERHNLRLLFSREGDGWYQFGTKRVNVKFESNLLKVRVGGGYITIEDYVEQNLPFELARLNADFAMRGSA